MQKHKKVTWINLLHPHQKVTQDMKKFQIISMVFTLGFFETKFVAIRVFLKYSLAGLATLPNLAKMPKFPLDTRNKGFKMPNDKFY